MCYLLGWEVFFAVTRTDSTPSFLLYDKVVAMAHWFHRNPLKATVPLTFDLGQQATTPLARNICRYSVSGGNGLTLINVMTFVLPF